MDDLADRPARPLADGEILKLGRHEMRWLDTPHLPHALGMRADDGDATRTLFCGDLFTQGGAGEVPLTEADILGPSEAFRQADGLLRALRRIRGDARAARQRAAGDARLHARQCLAR